MPTTRIDGLDFRTFDEGAGPAVVCVHGWGSGAAAWDTLVPLLTPRHRVVTYDSRGCGRTAHPSDGNTIRHNAADLIELCDALDVDRPVLVGSSIGAAVCTEAALIAPSRFAGLVAVDGPGHWATHNAGRLAGLLDGLAHDRAGTLAGWVPLWYHEADRSRIDATIHQILDSGRHVEHLFDDLVRYDPRPHLPRLSVPTTYVHGRHDTEVPLHVARTLAAATPGAELVVVEGAGHMPHQERPGEVAAVVARRSEHQVSRGSSAPPAGTPSCGGCGSDRL